MHIWGKQEWLHFIYHEFINGLDRIIISHQNITLLKWFEVYWRRSVEKSLLGKMNHVGVESRSSVFVNIYLQLYQFIVYLRFSNHCNLLR